MDLILRFEIVLTLTRGRRNDGGSWAQLWQTLAAISVQRTVSNRSEVRRVIQAGREEGRCTLKVGTFCSTQTDMAESYGQDQQPTLQQ